MSSDAQPLFDRTPFQPDPIGQPEPTSAGIPRLRTAERKQFVISTRALDELLPPDHTARLLWDYVSPNSTSVPCSSASRPSRDTSDAMPPIPAS